MTKKAISRSHKQIWFRMKQVFHTGR